MKDVLYNIDNLRIISQVFSPPVFNKIVRENNFLPFKKKVAKYVNKDYEYSNLQLIKFLYKSLQKNYRCEYIFKNNLILDILKNFCLKETLTINELKVGSSKADLVLLNGIVRIYEVKTELDSLGKLNKQLCDYQKFADKVYVVTDERYTKKIVDEYADTNIGVISLDKKNKLNVLKEANYNSLLFDFGTIFKILRKQEYLDLVASNFGSIPTVPNTKVFKACFNLLSQIDLNDFQKQVMNKIKERKLNQPGFLKSNKTPKELKHICNSLNFNHQEYQNLYHFLASNSQCTNHILEVNNLS